MKYKVIDLINNEKKDNNIDGVISFKDRIDSNILDVLDTDVYGTYSYDKTSETFTFYLTIQTKVTVPCAITLEPVEVLVDFDTDLYYTFKVVDDDSFPITGNEIKLDDEIWGEILMHIPMRVVKEGAEFSDEEVEIENPNNPFSSY